MPSPSDWRSPDTAPTNGCEFEYLTTDGEIKRGSLASDCGGAVKRDQRMIGWRCVSAAIATPETDAELRRDYSDRGMRAYLTSAPRTPPCDPNSLIGSWWFEGYDRWAAIDYPPKQS